MKGASFALDALKDIYMHKPSKILSCTHHHAEVFQGLHSCLSLKDDFMAQM